jgi:hypothetical protein
MIRRALAVAVGLFAVCFAVTAQQTNRSGPMRNRAVPREQLHAPIRFDPALALSLYQPNALSANDSFLFRKGPVHTWSDGGRLASENALAEIGMATIDVFPAAYLPPPNAFGSASPNRAGAPSNQRPGNFGSDPKDSPEMMFSPPDRFYYGGEVGFMYGRWSGKGSGDMMESYIMGTAGNDHFQITAGAAFENWSGNGARFRSFALPR